MSGAEPAVVVTGLPRSGTSLVMQMLAAGGMPVLSDGVRAPDEDNPRGYFEYAPVRATARDASWTADAAGRAVKVVLPLLGRLPAGWLRRAIWIQRDLHEVLASQREMLQRERSRRLANGLPADALLQTLRADPLRLREAMEEEMHFWQGWLPYGLQADDVLVVAHREVLGEPRAAAERLARFVRRPLDLEAMAAAVVPALWRQRG